jgi:hypothetical protein
MSRFEAALPYALVFVLIVSVLGASCGVWVWRYKECRAHGFSAFYCLTQR